MSWPTRIGIFGSAPTAANRSVSACSTISGQMVPIRSAIAAYPTPKQKAPTACAATRVTLSRNSTFARCDAPNSSEPNSTARSGPVGRNTRRTRPRQSASSMKPVRAYPTISVARASTGRNPASSGMNASTVGRMSRCRFRQLRGPVNPASRNPLSRHTRIVTTTASTAVTISAAVSDDISGATSRMTAAEVTTTMRSRASNTQANRRGYAPDIVERTTPSRSPTGRVNNGAADITPPPPDGRR